MVKLIGKSDCAYGRKIWAGVAKCAEGCPEWLRPRIREQAINSAKSILDAHRKGGE